MLETYNQIKEAALEHCVDLIREQPITDEGASENMLEHIPHLVT